MADVDAEDRTQAPSTLRVRQARERGQAAYSPVLTAAAGLVAATMLLGIVGGPLVEGLLAGMANPGELATSLTIDDVVARLRLAAFGVLGPVLALIVGPLAAAVLAHQAQTGGLWAPTLVAPDPARLFAGGRSGGAGRGAWAIIRAAVVLGVAAWAVRSRLDGLLRLGSLETAGLARAWVDAVRGMLGAIGGATVGVGLVDYALRRKRFLDSLRTTSEQSKQDQKAQDGDPAVRSRRRRQALVLRGDAPELLAGATLVVTGSGGLVVILTGGPAPAVVSVRSAAVGGAGAGMLRRASATGVPVLDAPAIAPRLARFASVPGANLPPAVQAELASVWPARG